jgi:hypothetical protein
MRHPDRPSLPIRRRVAFVILPFMVLLATPLSACASSHAHARHPQDSHWSSADSDGFGWAVIDGESDCMDGGMDDRVHAALAKAARASGTPVLWLRMDGRDWIVRDRALVGRAEGVLQPMRELGRQMGALGAEQGKLGARQGKHGAELGRLAAQSAALEVRLATAGLADDEESLGADERLELERERLELEREQARCERSRARAEMRGVEDRMRELGGRMEEMGRRMRVLSERAEREMRALAREAISARKAVRVGGAA